MPFYLRGGIGPLRYSTRLGGGSKPRRPQRVLRRGEHIAGAVMTAVFIVAMAWFLIAHHLGEIGLMLLAMGAITVLVNLARTPGR